MGYSKCMVSTWSYCSHSKNLDDYNARNIWRTLVISQNGDIFICHPALLILALATSSYGGYLKYKVYIEKPYTIPELKEAVDIGLDNVKFHYNVKLRDS